MSVPLVVLEKKVGETPLQTLEAYRAEHPELNDVPMTYAGRLDPMASGKLLVLIGDECKKKDTYTVLDKEYEFEVLFGVQSDTGDTLGFAELGESREVDEIELTHATKKLVGRIELSYPAYSSKTVDGKPLFQYAREGTLGEISVPTALVRIYRLEMLGIRVVDAEALLRDISLKIDTLGENKKDFRGAVVSTRWKEILEGNNREFPIARFRAIVSSGTYIRSLSGRIAKELDTHGLAFSIHRTKIGRFTSWGCFQWWRKLY